MIVVALAVLAATLMCWFSAVIIDPMTDEEIERLKMRIDPEAQSDLQRQDLRRTRITMTIFMLPVGVLLLVYALFDSLS